MLPFALHITLTLGFAESLGLAALLWLRAGSVAGVRYLALFLIGVAAWTASCEAPNWFGPAAEPFGMALLALMPLTSAVFLHFVLVLCRAPVSPLVLRLSYLLAGLTGSTALIWPAGHYESWAGIDYFFMPSAIGWMIGITWSALSIAGHGVLFLSWLRGSGPPRSQLVAMCLASGWGLMSMAGYASRPMGFDFFPYPLLLLPAYPVILVYGILRYQLMIVNAWARRALAWTLLVGLGSALVIGLATLPLPFGGVNSGWRLWAVAVATLLGAGLLLDPLRRLATRMIYPGSYLTEGTIEGWRARLGSAETFSALQSAASDALSRQLRIPIAVALGEIAGIPSQDTPSLTCRRIGEAWQAEFTGWDAAPPGPRHVAQLFGTVLAESAERLERSLGFAERERERQQQARLAELGALAATVAHDIRNPLNIIAMAAATAPPETRREIATQTARISQLASDLLDYAKAWQIERRPLNLADQLQAILPRYPEVALAADFPDPLTVSGDARRLGQALYNLFDNARAALAGRPGRIAIEADSLPDGGAALHICDDGPGIPAEIRETLFQPFVSRSTGGTGLGLAIVAKIMEAHGGTALVTDRPGWTTSFTLIFPPPEAS
jgi:signal transduction histidine kinase